MTDWQIDESEDWYEVVHPDGYIVAQFTDFDDARVFMEFKIEDEFENDA